MVVRCPCCKAGIEFRPIYLLEQYTHCRWRIDLWPAGQASLLKHLGNVDCSRASCKPAYNAAEVRQAAQTQPTAAHPCPPPTKSNLHSRSPEVRWYRSTPLVNRGIGPVC